MKRRSLIALAATSFVAASPLASMAAEPQAIKIIVPFAAGGTTDIIARIVAPLLSARLAQPVIVENVPGAGGSTGTKRVADAKPDGLTLGMATVSAFAANPALNPDKVGYDPLKSITPLMNIASTSNVIAVRRDFPANTFSEFAAVIKKNPGKYNFATSGVGSLGHLQMEAIKGELGLHIVHIPFSGANPAIAAVVGGQGPEIIFDQLPSIKNHILNGKLKLIVVASDRRLVMPLDKAPTFGELGYSQLNRPAWYGLVAPAGLPPAEAKRITDALEGIMSDFGARRKIEDTGSIVTGHNAEKFAKTIKAELEAAQATVKSRGIKLQ